MNDIKQVKIVGISLMIVGFLLLGAGTQVSEPKIQVNEVGDFNFSYAESVSPTPAIGSYTSQNISAEEVHTTYNISELNDSTREKIRTASEEGKMITDEFAIEEDKFIVRFGEEEDNDEVVYSAQPNGVLPQQITISGFISLIVGVLVLISMRGGRDLPDSIEREDSDSRWDFGLK